MGWEAIADYYIHELVRSDCQDQILTTAKKDSVKIIDDRVKELSKDTLYPRTIGDYISDH